MEMITMCVITWEVGSLRETSATQLPAPLRPTRQRTAVMTALHQRAGFTSAQELHEALEADGITIGLTTVYRTLHALERSGRLDVVREKSGERLYRPRPADGHRHYLVCRDCGLSTEVEAGVVERWAEGVAEGMGFTEVEHTVELTGVCDRCGFTRITPGPGSAEQRA
ncbi:Fur family transcriptional regulator [Streptomyces sp. SAI-129]|uniref:Fur family transcriptional regulator n=2 Tax=unclassified Streptomyces TaxID=2593676 RepID=UPI003C79E466